MYKVLACGSNGQYQLGLNHDEDVNILSEVLFNVEGSITNVILNVRKISCGGNHTLILLENGQVFSSGDNQFGQCGHPKGDQIKVFTLIPGTWSDISCGWEFSVLIAHHGVFVCGSGPKGELGNGEKVTDLIELEWGFGNIASVKSSLGHTVVELETGGFVGWGNCRKGQLGEIPPAAAKSGKLPASIFKPQLLVFADNLPGVKFNLGREFTIFYSSTDYKIYGKFNHDKLILNEPIASIHSMWSSNHLLIEKGNLTSIKSIGNNSHGQFQDTVLPFKQFTTGSEHGILETLDGIVFAWGWGEHGNCGIKEDEGTIYQLTKLYQGHVCLIAAGCATSWVVVNT